MTSFSTVRRISQTATCGPFVQDKVVTLRPYFKIKYMHVADWKKNADAFYEKTKTEKDMQSYGFTYQVDESILEHQMALVDEHYGSGQGVADHLANVGECVGKALTMSDLHLVEIHAPQSEMALLKGHKVLQDLKTIFYTLDPQGFRKPTGPYKDAAILMPYFKIHEGKLAEFEAKVKKFHEFTTKEKGVLNYAWSFTDDKKRAHCRESYVNAAGLIAHLENVGQTFAESLQLSDLERLEVHAPKSEMPPLKANETLKACNCVFYERDGKGIGM